MRTEQGPEMVKWELIRTDATNELSHWPYHELRMLLKVPARMKASKLRASTFLVGKVPKCSDSQSTTATRLYC